MPKLLKEKFNDKIRCYEDKAIKRSNFKLTCKKRGWDFSKFVETDSKLVTHSGEKIYFYILKKHCKTKEIKNDEENESIIKKMMNKYKIRGNDIVEMKMEEVKFYAEGMKIELEVLTNAICEVYFA